MPYDFTHRCNFRNKINKEKTDQPKTRLLTTENKLVAARGEVGGGWVKEVKGIKSTLALMSTEQCIEKLYYVM